MVNGVEDIPVDDNSMFGKFTRDTPDDSVDQYLKLLPAPFQRIPGTGCRKMVQVCYFIISVIVFDIFLKANIYLNYVLGLCRRVIKSYNKTTTRMDRGSKVWCSKVVACSAGKASFFSCSEF